MKKRHRDSENYPALYEAELRDKPLYYPNGFITIAPGEHRVTLHEGIFGVYRRALHDITGPLCLHIDALFKKQLLAMLDQEFARVYEWSLRVEFQGRGTEHVHLAMWAELKPGKIYVGRTGEEHSSALVPMLEGLFGGRVDVQLGSGYLNYINGYTAKASEGLNFTLKEHLSKDKPTPWLIAYRMGVAAAAD